MMQIAQLWMGFSKETAGEHHFDWHKHVALVLERKAKRINESSEGRRRIESDQRRQPWGLGVSLALEHIGSCRGPAQAL